MAKAMLEQAGARCMRYPFVEDDPDRIREAVRKAVKENDIVWSRLALQPGAGITLRRDRNFGEVLVHGIAIKENRQSSGGKKSEPVLACRYPLSALTVIEYPSVPCEVRPDVPNRQSSVRRSRQQSQKRLDRMSSCSARWGVWAAGGSFPRSPKAPVSR